MVEKRIEKRNVEAVMGLTSMQEGMLFHHLANPQSYQYFEQIRLTLSGWINLQQFKEAWNFITRANEVLRSVFRWKKLDNPIQIILENHEIPIHFFDLNDENREKCQKCIKDIIERDKNESIDLSRAPFRIKLCRMSENKNEMIIAFHHILLDGWSLGIVLSEFMDAINRIKSGEILTPLKKTKYKEFYQWYKTDCQQRNLKEQEFWQRYLKDFDTRTMLPYDRNKMSDIKQVHTWGMELDSSLFLQVESCAQVHNITISTIFYTAWGILLQKYNNSDDVIFGTTVSGRVPEIKGIEHIAGLFINTLPLRLNTVKTAKVSDIYTKVGKHLQERDAYQHSSLTQMKRFTQLDNTNALLESVIVMDNYPLDKILNEELPSGIIITAYDKFEMTNFDLTLQIMIIDTDRIKIDFHYNADCFESATIERMQGHYREILDGITSNSSLRLAEVTVPTDEEKRQIMEEFNTPHIKLQVDRTIHSSIEAQVVRTPDNKAVQFHEEWLTYDALNKKANILARRLKAHGVRTGIDRVALLVPRSLEMIVAVLAILKAGAACIPLDAAYPAERNSFIIQDSEAKFIITNLDKGDEKVIPPGVIKIDYGSVDSQEIDNWAKNLEISAAPKDLAYIIYTSGSTGYPKGALLHHSGIVNHTYTKIHVLGITAADIVGNNFSINVIASVWQILSPLFTGGRLVVYHEKIEWDPYAQFMEVEKDRVTVIEVIPSILKAYLFALAEGKEKIELKSLRKIALTSEETKPSLVNRFYKTYSHIDLVDCYGQTECCDDVLHYTIPYDIETVKVPVGTPSLNTQVFILSHHRGLQPLSIPGEICVIGAGVAYGYWKRPQLNAEKFVESPLPEIRGRLYNTGDLGRWLPDGKIEYLGRIDHQVKIRGNRVELREIENRMMQYPLVKEAAVVDREDKQGDKNLYAFFVSSQEIKVSEIRAYLLRVLPDYMIPAYFVPMEKLPLTPNGKIDRKELRKMEIREIISTGTDFQLPGNELETKIREIWSRMLEKNIEEIGINDNFFHLGGHSLKITALLGRIYKELKIDVPFQEVFNRPTIKELALYLSSREKSISNEIILAEEKEYYCLSSAQKRLLALQQMDEKGIGYNIPSIWQLEGKVDEAKLTAVFHRLIRRHESLRTSFTVIGNEPVQRIHSGKLDLPIRRYGLTDGMDNMMKEFIRPFDLNQAPLLRLGLVESKNKRAGTEFLLLVDIHHIISDGVSMHILINDWAALYRGEDLKPLPFRYRDYSEWQTKEETKTSLLHQEEYWLKKFTGNLPDIHLPLDYAKPETHRFECDTISFQIDKTLSGEIRKLILETGTTVYMLLLSIYTILLSLYSESEDIIVGTPVAGRTGDQWQKIVGMFVNMLVMRNFPQKNKTFKNFLGEVKENTLEAFRNQDYQFDQLVYKLGMKKNAGSNPLIETVFTLQNTGNGNGLPVHNDEELIIKPYPFKVMESKFHLTLDIIELEGRLDGWFTYSISLFKRATIERMKRNYLEILEQVVNNVDMKLEDISLAQDSVAQKTDILSSDDGDFGF